jgi:anti-sigma regulatory factor (Ser/Thr protein kinase)
VASARRFCLHRLTQVIGDGVAAQNSIDDAVLVTSELVTNALHAGCGHVVIAVDVHRSHVGISVEDDGHGLPQLQHPTETEGHGRGLQIVEQLSRAWGVSPRPIGKTVWADLALPTQLTTYLSCTQPDST